jgi:hypothetical protein
MFHVKQLSEMDMKKVFFLLFFGICAYVQAFAQPIPVKVVSYLIGRRETAAQYERGELIINDETQSWEIILYKKTGGPDSGERILMKNFADIGNGNAVFRSITITEGSKSTGADLFAYFPVFKDGKIQIDLCDNKTERTRRRLIISPL